MRLLTIPDWNAVPLRRRCLAPKQGLLFPDSWLDQRPYMTLNTSWMYSLLPDERSNNQIPYLFRSPPHPTHQITCSSTAHTHQRPKYNPKRRAPHRDRSPQHIRLPTAKASNNQTPKDSDPGPSGTKAKTTATKKREHKKNSGEDTNDSPF
ncbi:hypothetical protein CHS0354_034354 [Potamilus streckersoni]|uniref:Uncharacterized protein n=1 Tax=Potamilus streckersoni TaxID=2493646 RepID=A0AAE0TKK5_9BIVA|nr:hypothetical protein CHS0354_034354 [Potamilus streckersoni]